MLDRAGAKGFDKPVWVSCTLKGNGDGGGDEDGYAWLYGNAGHGRA
jgi:hypothetical protein